MNAYVAVYENGLTSHVLAGENGGVDVAQAMPKEPWTICFLSNLLKHRMALPAVAGALLGPRYLRW